MKKIMKCGLSGKINQFFFLFLLQCASHDIIPEGIQENLYHFLYYTEYYNRYIYIYIYNPNVYNIKVSIIIIPDDDFYVKNICI